MRGVRFSPYEKRRALKRWLDEKEDIFKVAKQTKCSERTLWRWKSQYDGTLESLNNASSKPHTPHPNAHTEEEAAHIKELFDDNPNISYAEALGVLRTKYAYSRTYFGFYRFVKKSGLRPSKQIEKYVEQPYITPEMLGVKMQMDVKYVPRECKRGEFAHERDYQYTMIDEATRERFIYPYREKSIHSTMDFIKRALVYFGYLPGTIQTDNGTEFTNPKNAKETTVCPVDELLAKLGIRHKLIRPFTPRHNGKVERSHRTDQENFYNHLTYSSFEELKEKMAEWNVRYNNRPHSSLRNREGKRVWLTPLQKRAELLEDLKENTEYKIRFLKKAA